MRLNHSFPLTLLLLATGTSLASTKADIPAKDWAQIRAEYERHRHQITNNQANSPNQGWKTTFSPTGFLVTPKQGDWTWGLNLKSYGLADQIQTIGAPTQSTTHKNELRHQHDNLTHWFINAPSGLEEGWTIQSRPAGKSKELVVTLEIQGSLAARADGNGARFLNASQQTILNYNGLQAWDANGKALPATMAAQDGEIQIRVGQQDAQYPITIDPIAQQAFLKASNPGSTDLFGYSVAIAGDTLVVGAIGEDSSSTGVNSTPNESAANSGAVYVFTRSQGAWSQQAYLKPSNPNRSDEFGYSVAISGDTIVVGAWGEDSSTSGSNSAPNELAENAGAAYVFTRSNGIWSQQAYLKSSNPGAGDQFGTAVAIAGDTIVVGASREDSSTTSINSSPNESATDAGAAYVFVRSVDTWSQQAYLKAADAASGDQFGAAVAISGETIAIGAFLEDHNIFAIDGGAAYVFTRSVGAWSQQAYLTAANTVSPDHFGVSVGISGDTIVVGADKAPSPQGFTGKGLAYVFTRSSNTWSLQSTLVGSNTDAFDHFGSAVAISGETIVIGAKNESSSTQGINPPFDDAAAFSGAAYVFTRFAGNWSQLAFLKASNSGQSDQFGWSVGISADSIVIGSIGEDSSTSGANPTPDEAAPDAGAAYVFLLTADPPITISSSPTNLLFSSTGNGCSPGSNFPTPQTLPWVPGASCIVTFPTPQSGGARTQFVFQQWEDSSVNASRTFTAPATAATFTANFKTQFLLTLAANPTAGGRVSPLSATFFDDKSIAPVNAVPNQCYVFANWSGAILSNGASVASNSVAMTGPINLTANFTRPTRVPATKGAIVPVAGTPTRFRQTISVTNTLSTTADVSVGISSLGPLISIASTPTGTSTSCLPPSGSPFFTITNVPPGQTRDFLIVFNAPSPTAISYTATAIVGAGSR